MAFVQGAAANTGSGANVASFAVAFPSANAGACCIVVDVVFTTAHGIGSVAVTDSQGNSYSPAVLGEDSTTGIWAGVYVATGCHAGANTVTITYTGTDSLHDVAMAIHEYANVTAVDAYAYSTWASAKTATATVTQAYSNDIVHAACFTQGGTSFLTLGGTSFTAREIIGGYDSILSGDVAVSQSIGSTVTASFHARNTRNIVCIVVALKVSGAPATPGTAWIYANEPGAGLTDRSRYLRLGKGAKHTFTSTLRNRGTAEIPLYIPAGDSFLSSPSNYVGVQIYLYDQPPSGAALVWAGSVEQVDVEFINVAGARSVTLHLVSFHQAFDVLLVPPQSFFYGAAQDIFTSLFGSVANGVPVALGTVSASFVINSLTCNWDKLSDVFSKLATAASCIWGIDIPTLTAYLKPVSTTASPYTLHSGQILFGSVKWNQNRQDYCNRFILKISPDAFSQSAESFGFSGAPQSFQLMRPAQSITGAWFTYNTSNSATASFSGLPSDGDTVEVGYPQSGSIYNWAPAAPYALGQIIIDPSNHVQKCTVAGLSGNSQPSWNDTGGTTSDGPGTPNPNGLGGAVWTDLGVSGAGGLGASVYTFKTVLDNRQWGQVLIDPYGSVAQTEQNLIDAINANQATAGTAFSWPTWENPLLNAVSNTGSGFTVENKTPGAGYSAALSASSSAFSWSASATSGGTTSGGTVSLQVAANGSSNSANIYYTPGSSVVAIASRPSGVPVSGGIIQIQYQRYAGDCIVVEDSASVATRAALENGTGKYQKITSDTSVTSNTLGYQTAQSTLAAYDVIPTSFSFVTYKAGLQTGQLLSISVASGYPTGLAALVNGFEWVVQEIQADLVPAKPYVNQTTAPGGGHYRYTVTVINVNQIDSYLEFWQGINGGGGGGGQIVAGSPAASATAVPTPVISAGGAAYVISNVSNTFTPDLSQVGIQSIALVADSTVLAATSVPSGSNYSLTIIVTQDSSGGHTITFSSAWQGVPGLVDSSGNTTPDIDLTPNTYSIFSFTLSAAGNMQLTDMATGLIP